MPAGLEPPFVPHVNEHFLRSQSDAFTDRVYSVPGVRTVRYEWSRFVVDPNRAPHQQTEGGVVPVTDFSDRPLYPAGGEPTAEQVADRVERYHRTFHDTVADAVSDPQTRFFIDGHSMAGDPPVRSPDYGTHRPDAVISNIGDGHGNPSPGTPFLTCSPDLTRWLAERLTWWMRAIPAPEAGSRAAVTGDVWLNNPFRGGYGVRTHAALHRGLPGVQLELNQRMWADEETFRPLHRRIPWIREVLRSWCRELTAHFGEAERAEVARAGLR